MTLGHGHTARSQSYRPAVSADMGSSPVHARTILSAGSSGHRFTTEVVAAALPGRSELFGDGAYPLSGVPGV
jgi:hypothetical protein